MAVIPPKLTEAVAVKLVPVMVTVVPLLPEVGVKEERVGAMPKVNPSKEVVPAAVVTATFPVVPVPTIAVIPVAESIVKDCAFVPPNFTEVAPVKLEPKIFTTAPAVPFTGSNLLIYGPR